jgi:hypothetical protein
MKRTVQGSRIGNAQTYLLNLVVLAIFVGMGLANWSAILYPQGSVNGSGKASQEGGYGELKTAPLGGGSPCSSVTVETSSLLSTMLKRS